MIKTNEEARQFFQDCGFKYQDLTKENLTRLRRLIDKEMIEGEYMGGTLECEHKIRVKTLKNIVQSAFIYCEAYYFSKRECVSFNQGGFIGFAGWSDSTNIKPILAGFETWCIEMKEKAANC